MDIDRSDAEAALAEIRSAEQRIREALRSRGAAYPLVIWGVVLFIGYTVTQFHAYLPDSAIHWTWIILSVAGNAIGWTIGLRAAKKFRHPLEWRIHALWILFLLYGILFAFFVHPTDGTEVSLLVLMFVTLWMGVMGLWLEPVMVGVSLSVAALAVFGYVVLLDWFFLWLAILGGGTLFGSGLFLLRRRSSHG